MIYIHIPYCRSFCTYCDFYSEIPSGGTAEGGMSAYVDALCAEIAARAGEIPWEHDTLYIGGGTPSVLPLGVLRRIVSALTAARGAGRVSWEEFTVEVNPDDVVKRGEEYIRGLAALGVNRISMGVQSLDDDVLRWMNRRHNSQQAREAYRILRKAGIENISVDLIFGLGEPYGKMGIFESTVEEILNIGGDGMPPKHISAYQLSIEPGSALAAMAADGRYIPAADELCARQYEVLCERLAEAGYNHYEISNFAQPGYESRHNSAYWRHIPYIGFGPAAHSFFIKPCPTAIAVRPAGENVRSPICLCLGKSLDNNDIQDSSRCFSGIEPAGQEMKVQYIRLWNEPNVNSYLRAARSGDFSSISESETLTAEQIREERVMLALRTSDGIDPAELPSARLSIMLKSGSLVPQGSRVRIPESKFFVSDDIISDLI